jgi:3-phenylpropionate/cinnamic acid dioxygenase small subunit
MAEIEAFLFHEARLLDDALYDDWLALYTDTAWYWVPIQPRQDNPFDTVSIIYDDRKLLETRVRRLRNENIHAQSPPSRTSRIIGNIVTARPDETGGVTACDFQISSRFQMVEYRRDEQRLFAGALLHGLVRDGEGFKIAWKRVDLVNCDAMMEGITVPF